MRSAIAILTGVVALGTTVLAQFEMLRSTIDGGGVMNASGGAFELSGTIGQPDAGVMAGGSFELTGGFWFALEPGDCDESGAVGLHDHQNFVDCLLGPGLSLPSGCECFDVDGSGRIDLADFAENQFVFLAE